MKKKLLPILLIVSIIGWFGYRFTIQTIVGMLTDYDPYTFELVFEDSLLLKNYGLTTEKSPVDYGFEKVEVEEVSFNSPLDQLVLSGWYVNSAPKSDSTILIIHGRTSNRLKTMKYLRLFKETGLDSIYNFFIPDMRNSGKSASAPTYMGYKFAEDLLGAISYLQKNQGQEAFIVYAFSMGAMATSSLLHRDDLNVPKDKIRKLIFDSPLADVSGNVQRSASKMGLPDFLFQKAFTAFGKQANGYPDHMKMGIQLKGVNIPILILQSNDDKTTPSSLTKTQLVSLTNQSNIQAWFIDGPEHVQLYTSETHRQGYTDKVVRFLQN